MNACRTVFDTSSEEKCTTSYKKECDMVYETADDYEYEQKCTTTYEEKFEFFSVTKIVHVILFLTTTDIF